MRKWSAILFLVIGLQTYSQETLQKNNYVFFEGLGSAGRYSLNYEKTLYRGVYYRDFIRVGLGIFYDSWTKLGVPNQPFSYYLQYNVPIIIGTENGTKQLKYELGVGLLTAVGEPIRYYNSVSHMSPDKYGFCIVGNLGLRYYFIKAPLFFKATYTPVYIIGYKQILPLWVGGSIGYKF
jgi:hypothetical protein